jgi:hypothetical protein
MKYVSLNLMQVPGPAQACTGIALPLHFHMNSIKHFFIKPHGKKSFGNASHRWMYNVKMFLEEIN